jgi:isoquinoline 1-oxidoreductase beta subunit
MLSLRLPCAKSEALAADADGFAPNAFIRIGSDGQIVLTMPTSRWVKGRTRRARC